MFVAFTREFFIPARDTFMAYSCTSRWWRGMYKVWKNIEITPKLDLSRPSGAPGSVSARLPHLRKGNENEGRPTRTHGLKARCPKGLQVSFLQTGVCLQVPSQTARNYCSWQEARWLNASNVGLCSQWTETDAANSNYGTVFNLKLVPGGKIRETWERESLRLSLWRLCHTESGASTWFEN